MDPDMIVWFANALEESARDLRAGTDPVKVQVHLMACISMAYQMDFQGKQSIKLPKSSKLRQF
jgi:hypothetical protein